MTFRLIPAHRRTLCLCGLALLLTLTAFHTAQAEVVWQCSRSKAAARGTGDNDGSDVAALALQGEAGSFELANFGGTLTNFDLSGTDVIMLELTDLYAAYAGEIIPMGKGFLSVCFISGKSRLHNEAMEILGIKPQGMEILLKRTRETPKFFHAVSGEAQMEACIEQHHPALGYLSEATDTPSTSPCF